MSKLDDLQPSIRLSIYNPSSGSNSVFGKGIADLCNGVREMGSLNASAKNMHMAYSKAWRIIKDTEDALGVELLIRDGAHGSTLTDEANRLLDIYYMIIDELNDEAGKIYQKEIK